MCSRRVHGTPFRLRLPPRTTVRRRGQHRHQQNVPALQVRPSSRAPPHGDTTTRTAKTTCAYDPSEQTFRSRGASRVANTRQSTADRRIEPRTRSTAGPSLARKLCGVSRTSRVRRAADDRSSDRRRCDHRRAVERGRHRTKLRSPRRVDGGEAHARRNGFAPSKNRANRRAMGACARRLTPRPRSFEPVGGRLRYRVECFSPMVR